MIEFDVEHNQLKAPLAKIKVLGVGGAGSNMINTMIDAGYDGIDFIVANTDAQALKSSKAEHKIQLGQKSTKGLGAGANPDLGRRAAEEDIDAIMDTLKTADIVFLAAGMGGGTGSGALPVIARALRERDILTVGVVTKPFMFEGKRRMKVAQDALDLIKREVDTLIVLPNQKLIEVSNDQQQKLSLMNAFTMINSILNQFIKVVADIIAKPGYINVDFADLKTIMKQKGFALIGSGRFAGEQAARNAAIQAISSPLLDNMHITGARGVLVNISGSSQLGLQAVSEAASIIYEQVHEEAIIVFGSSVDESLADDILVTVIATGFSGKALQQSASMAGIEHEAQSPAEQAPAHSSQVDQQETTTYNTQTQSTATATVDLDDLDIPAFMRKVAREQQTNNYN